MDWKLGVGLFVLLGGGYNPPFFVEHLAGELPVAVG